MLLHDDLPADERPREKLCRRGAHALSDTELVTIALGTGISGTSVSTIAREILTVIDRQRGAVDVAALEAIRGVGQAKATLIAAMLEFSRRRIRPEGVRIRSAADVIPLVNHLADRKQEHFVCISLNGAHEVLRTRVVTIGLLNTAQVHPREVFSDVLIDRAAAVIFAHNHPSGDVTPSTEDIRATELLCAAGETLGITVLDHIVFSHRGYTSFEEQKLIRRRVKTPLPVQEGERGERPSHRD
jgi:DNA repair protein RadC